MLWRKDKQTHAQGNPTENLSSLSTYTRSHFCPLQWLWNPAGTGELKQTNLHLICLTVYVSKCVEKHLILLGECGKHFQLSRTPRPQWQMGRVWGWHGRGHFRTGCCSKPCGRQSKPICHKKIKLTLELPNQGPGRAPARSSAWHGQPLCQGASLKTSQEINEHPRRKKNKTK